MWSPKTLDNVTSENALEGASRDAASSAGAKNRWVILMVVFLVGVLGHEITGKGALGQTANLGHGYPRMVHPQDDKGRVFYRD